MNPCQVLFSGEIRRYECSKELWVLLARYLGFGANRAQKTDGKVAA